MWPYEASRLLLQTPTMTMKTTAVQFRFREPTVHDGAAIWSLVQHVGTLELNSAYSYLMISKFLSNTSVVLVHNEQIIGFLSAFQPAQRDSVFVWQVAVHPSYQGHGWGKGLLKALLQRPACQGIRYLYATVTPSNSASKFMFQGLARELDTSCETSECFPRHLFPNEDHEPEVMVRIGPLS